MNLTSSADWIPKKLEDEIEICYGKGLPGIKRNPRGKYPVYGSNGIIDRSDEYLVDEPTIVIGRKGSAGKVTLAQENCYPIDTTYYVRIKSPSKLNLKFLYYTLLHLDLERIAQTGPVPGIGRSELYRLQFLQPPIEVQEKIVDKLDSLMLKLYDREKALDELRLESKQKLSLLIKSFIAHHINNNLQLEEPPAKWTKIRFADTFTECKEKWNPDGGSCELNYIGLENIESSTGQLVNFKPTNSADIKSTKNRFTRNDVLYGKLRPYLNKVLLPAFDGVCSTDIVVLTPKECINREYLSYWLRSTHVVSQISNQTYGTKMPRMKVSDLGELFIHLPSLDEQKRIVDNLKEIESNINLIKEKNSKLINYFTYSETQLKKLQGAILARLISQN